MPQNLLQKEPHKCVKLMYVGTPSVLPYHGQPWPLHETPIHDNNDLSESKTKRDNGCGECIYTDYVCTCNTIDAYEGINGFNDKKLKGKIPQQREHHIHMIFLEWQHLKLERSPAMRERERESLISVPIYFLEVNELFLKDSCIDLVLYLLQHWHTALHLKSHSEECSSDWQIIIKAQSYWLGLHKSICRSLKYKITARPVVLPQTFLHLHMYRVVVRDLWMES